MALLCVCYNLIVITYYCITYIVLLINFVVLNDYLNVVIAFVV